MAQQRDTSIDAVCGIMIIHMILGHVAQWAHLTDTDAVYLFMQKALGFFMLWFCYKSGIFFKCKSINELAMGGGKRLLIPFVVFSTIGYLTYSTRMLLLGETNWKQFIYPPVKQFITGGAIGGNLPLWYLTTLYVARIIFNYVLKDKTHIALIVIFAIPFIVHITQVENIPLWISNIPMAVSFMALGCYLKNKVNNKWIVFPCLTFFVIMQTAFPTYVDMRYNNLLYGNYFSWYPVALSGIIAIDGCLKMCPIRLNLLEYFGRNSMVFLCCHWIILTLCSIGFILLGMDTSNYTFVIISICMIFMFIPCFNQLLERRNIKWIIGE